MRIAGVAAQVLVGQEEELFVLRKRPFERAARRCDEVQTSPPRSPQKALIAAVEFI